MEAKELRISNIISDGVQPFVVKELCSLGKNSLNKNIGAKFDLKGGGNAWIDLNDCEPIPLTEEWFLKLGFEEFDGIFCHKNQFHIQYSILPIPDKYGVTHIHVTTPISNETGVHLSSIQYVHQLQNLYFALTGEELTIKE